VASVSVAGCEQLNSGAGMRSRRARERCRWPHVARPASRCRGRVAGGRHALPLPLLLLLPCSTPPQCTGCAGWACCAGTVSPAHAAAAAAVIVILYLIMYLFTFHLSGLTNIMCLVYDRRWRLPELVSGPWPGCGPCPVLQFGIWYACSRSKGYHHHCIIAILVCSAPSACTITKPLLRRSKS
jgi:hypothetical protein